MSHTDEINILMALRELLTTNAEWRDKVIYALPDDDDETPLDDLDYQNWATTVYLPVPVAAKDKSENAAFDRFVAHLRERGKVLAAIASPAAAPTSQPNAAAQEQQATDAQIRAMAPRYGTMFGQGWFWGYKKALADIAAHGIAPAPTGMGSVGLPSVGKEQA